ncbi:MAG: hypothetical protein JWP34_4534 [Massilia sp.]|nr:hypothetical protein [Gemmatimonadales bacterium]MDB5910420.1 hypothetical protein [Massilia sp.]
MPSLKLVAWIVAISAATTFGVKHYEQRKQG